MELIDRFLKGVHNIDQAKTEVKQCIGLLVSMLQYHVSEEERRRYSGDNLPLLIEYEGVCWRIFWLSVIERGKSIESQIQIDCSCRSSLLGVSYWSVKGHHNFVTDDVMKVRSSLEHLLSALLIKFPAIQNDVQRVLDAA